MQEILALDYLGTAVVCIVAGLVSFLYAGERILGTVPGLSRLVETKDKDSKFFRYVSAGMGFIAFALVIALFITANNSYHWFTIFMLVIYGIVILAHPIKNIEAWWISLIAIPVGIIALAAIIYLDDDNLFSLFGIVEIPLKWILLLVAVILVILFLIVYFVEETMIDPILSIIGWAPLTVIVGIIILIQGVLLFVFHPAGLAELLPSVLGNR